MHYAIMTGGDISPLGKDGVTEIHKLFDWAQTTPRGLIIFVDEADAFLRKRSVEKLSEDLRNALNAFLYRTGEASYQVMIVYASNQPEQFDWAVIDRIDEVVFFDLPKYEERLHMLKHYMNYYIRHPLTKSANPIKLEGIDDTLLESIAKQTEGFSGREMSKLVISFQAMAYGDVPAVLTPALIARVMEATHSTKQKKQKWLHDEEIDKIVQNASESASRAAITAAATLK